MTTKRKVKRSCPTCKYIPKNCPIVGGCSTQPFSETMGMLIDVIYGNKGCEAWKPVPSRVAKREGK